MTEENTLTFRNEGDPAFAEEDENDNSGAGAADTTNENGENDGSSTAGEKKPDAQKPKEVPFDQHPEWQDREKKWDTRFNDQESRHQEDMRKLREEFGEKKKDNAENTAIPAWFGGDQAQWDAYRADRDAELTAAEERAAKRITGAEEAKTKAVEEATQFMQSELTAIESDKTLNPDGAKIDPNKLLKFVLDNDLVDSKGRWNYRAGFRMMTAAEPAKKPAGNKKVLAGATTSEGKPETQPAAFKTSADFKKNKPW